MNRESEVLLALDPSVKSSGIAIFVDGTLEAAHTFKEPRGRTKLPPVGRCLDMAESISVRLQGKYRPTVYVTEWPVVYGPGKGKGNPSGLLYMPGVSSALGAMLMIDPALKPYRTGLIAYQYLPREWCMGTSKPSKGSFRDYVVSSRGERIISRLTECEKRVWIDQVTTHDAGDAVGIGLKHLGRFERKRVYGRD